MDEEKLEKVLGLILESLRRMEDPVETGQPKDRPTTALPKADWVKWVMQDVLKERKAECVQNCKDRIAIAKKDLKRDIDDYAKKLQDFEDVLSGVAKATDATKTTTGRVIDNMEFLELIRERGLAIFLTEWKQSDGHEEHLDYVWNWVIGEEERRLAAIEGSRFKIGTILTIIGIVCSFGVGLASLLYNIFSN